MHEMVQDGITLCSEVLPNIGRGHDKQKPEYVDERCPTACLTACPQL